MTTFIKDAEGNDIEVLTPEEIEAQKQEAVAPLQEELEKAKEELDKFKNKDMNFSNLRKQIEEREKRIQDLETSIDSKLETVKKEVFEGVLKDHYNETKNALTGGDEELAKQIEFHYKRLADKASTKDEITSKLKDAWVLAMKDKPEAFNSSAFSSGGAGRLNIKSNDTKVSPEEMELGSKMGLSKEDFEKYGKK